MSDIAIRVKNVKKQYRLGAIGGRTLSAEIESWWARKRGKEDPNTLIGTDQSKIGETFYALNGVDFEVKKGEAIGIIGSNGAGKSTLLKLLSRVTVPTSGEIYINGRITSMLEVGTGFHGELTGRENIYMNGAILGMSKSEIDEKMEDIIEFSECRQFIDTPVKRYSSGMYVKLAFAVAAHLDSDIMIMDEVLAVGDMKFQEKCLGKMGSSSQEEGKTVLYVSHNMSTIRQLCSRCIVLDKGKIIFDGETEDAISIYMNEASKNLVSFLDLNNVERSSLQPGKKIRMLTFEFLDKKIPVYDSKEKIRFKVRWIAGEDIKDLRMYFVVRYTDASIVGMTQSYPFDDGIKGEVRETIFEFDISNLADGLYYFRPDIFSMNQSNNHQSYDHPLINIYFKIASEEQNGMYWQRQYFGNVKLNMLEHIEKNSVKN